MFTSPGGEEYNNAPPPPPPPEDPRSKVSPSVLKLKTTTPITFYNALKPARENGLVSAPPGQYFFYGTLTDPSMVSEILSLDEEPDFRPAYVEGYECKLWGQYPALLHAPGSVVEGAVYDVRSAEDAERLATYETNSYRAEPCLIRCMDGKNPTKIRGYAFKFVGNPYDLSEGGFDLRAWLKRMGRQAALDKFDAKRVGVQGSSGDA